MLQGFRERRAWAAALVTFVLSPTLGMLYLGKGWLGLIYLALETVTFVGFRLFAPSMVVGGIALSFLIQLLIRVGGTIHAIAIARGDAVDFRSKWYSHWYAIAGIAFGPLVVALLLRTFVFQLFDIPSGSMIPNLMPGDYLIVSKSAYLGAEPERGDLVVLRRNHQDYLKRIAGLPGDRIQMVGGVLEINGKPVLLARLGNMTVRDAMAGHRHITIYRETLPGGRSYTIGDQIDDGPFDNTDIYIVPAHSYFVLGDNRDDSNDSRADLGYIQRDALEGRVWRKYWDGRESHVTWSNVP